MPVSCKRSTADSPASAHGSTVPNLTADSGSAPSPQPPDDRVALTVNGAVILAREIDDLSRREGISREEAIRLTVQAEVVSAEAGRADFPGAKAGRDRLAISRDYLETVFSKETLCSSITDTHIRQLYEITYQPSWPVDVYRGEVLEVRCCPHVRAPCDEAEVAACLRRNSGIMEIMEAAREAWATRGVAPNPVVLAEAHSEVRLTDFGLTRWPDLAPDKRRPGRLFESSVQDEVMKLAVGQVSPPIRSGLGYHLFKLTQFRRAIRADSPEFVAQAREELCRNRVERTRWDYVSRLIKNSVVEEK